MPNHKTGNREEWLAARLELLKAEKELTRRSDELARQRQDLPWVPVETVNALKGTFEPWARLARMINGASAQDVFVQADIDLSAGQAAGLAARYSGTRDNNMYWGGITQSGASSFTASIYKNVGGVSAVTPSQQPQASLPGEIVSQGVWYDFEAKYTEGGMDLRVPAPIGDEAVERVRELAVSVFTLAGCSGLARCDFFLEADGRVLVNEINTMPGFTETSVYAKLWEATGLAYPDLCDRLLELNPWLQPTKAGVPGVFAALSVGSIRWNRSPSIHIPIGEEKGRRHYSDNGVRGRTVPGHGRAEM